MSPLPIAPPAPRPSPLGPGRADLIALTTCAHEARLTRTTITGLVEYDALERNHDALRHVRWCTFSLGAGFAFAVFPFTPGVVDYCKPSANPGWLCGARVAALLAACEATWVGIGMGLDIWRDRRWVESEAARLSLQIGRLCRNGPRWPAELFAAYRKADAPTRERIKALLRRSLPLESL